MKIDQSQKYDVYQFASKGYELLGSTCRWFYGDSKLLVGDGGKDGKFGLWVKMGVFLAEKHPF